MRGVKSTAFPRFTSLAEQEPRQDPAGISEAPRGYRTSVICPTLRRSLLHLRQKIFELATSGASPSLEPAIRILAAPWTGAVPPSRDRHPVCCHERASARPGE